MLTRLRVRNFKMLEELDIELGDRVVFIGPNNSGKTTAMQALTLWHEGLRTWRYRRNWESVPETRPGVAINRRSLTTIPGLEARPLWHLLKLRRSRTADGKQKTENVRIEVLVDGQSDGHPWQCGLEFDYANEESIYCRPLRVPNGEDLGRMAVPDEAADMPISYLSSMSGVASLEDMLQPGAINVRVGEGRTGDVLRNICYTLWENYPERWETVTSEIKRLFGTELNIPLYDVTVGRIEMSYQEKNMRLDLSATGRGLQQTLLLLAFMLQHPGAVLLIDEPDAHLETLRQREIYDLLATVATENSNQIIVASHSEALLNHSAQSDAVIAFVGRPHRIAGQQSQIAKALNQIGWEQYAQAQEKGWVLYLEGATDLRVLQALARRLNHQRAIQALERPFVRYIGNVISRAQEHYYGLRVAAPDLKACALLDRADEPAPAFPDAEVQTWHLREIENYLGGRATLEAYARAQEHDGADGSVDPVTAMSEAIASVETAARVLGQPPIWSADAKMSDDVLVPIFREFNQQRNQYNDMPKSNLHRLAAYIPDEALDPEITEKLDAIADVAESATPAGG